MYLFFYVLKPVNTRVSFTCFFGGTVLRDFAGSPLAAPTRVARGRRTAVFKNWSSSREPMENPFGRPDMAARLNTEPPHLHPILGSAQLPFING